jgi:hypothetical protein
MDQGSIKPLKAIFVAASNHAIEEVEPLLESVTRHVPDARIVLLVYPKDLRRKKVTLILKRYSAVDLYLAPRIGRRLQPIAHLLLRLTPFPSLGLRKVMRWLRGSLHITLERFVSLKEFLAGPGSKATELMIADGRDVLVQENPFMGLGESVVTGEEGVSMGLCATNSGWFKELYGEAELRKISSQPVLCSGVTLGKRNPLFAYLAAMEREIWDRARTIRGRGYFDQAIHNRVLRSGEVDFEASPVSGGRISTLGYPGGSHVAWEVGRRSVLVDGVRPPVVHQYDRVLKT